MVRIGEIGQRARLKLAHPGRGRQQAQPRVEDHPNCRQAQTKDRLHQELNEGRVVCAGGLKCREKADHSFQRFRACQKYPDPNRECAQPDDGLHMNYLSLLLGWRGAASPRKLSSPRERVRSSARTHALPKFGPLSAGNADSQRHRRVADRVALVPVLMHRQDQRHERPQVRSLRPRPSRLANLKRPRLVARRRSAGGAGLPAGSAWQGRCRLRRLAAGDLKDQCPEGTYSLCTGVNRLPFHGFLLFGLAACLSRPPGRNLSHCRSGDVSLSLRQRPRGKQLVELGPTLLS